jgi:hypothetical protein
MRTAHHSPPSLLFARAVLRRLRCNRYSSCPSSPSCRRWPLWRRPERRRPRTTPPRPGLQRSTYSTSLVSPREKNARSLRPSAHKAPIELWIRDQPTNPADQRTFGANNPPNVRDQGCRDPAGMPHTTSRSMGVFSRVCSVHHTRGRTTLHRTGASRQGPVYSLARRNSWALIATMTVLADIKTAANAGGSRIPRDTRTPAASGIATML